MRHHHLLIRPTTICLGDLFGRDALWIDANVAYLIRIFSMEIWITEQHQPYFDFPVKRCVSGQDLFFPVNLFGSLRDDLSGAFQSSNL